MLYTDKHTPVAVFPGQVFYFFGQGPVFGVPNPFGTVDTNGTAVTLDSGFPFDAGMASPPQTIEINGVNHTVETYNSPPSITLSGSAGVQSKVSFNFPSYNKFSAPQYESIAADAISQAVSIASQPGMHPVTDLRIQWETLFQGTVSGISVVLQESIIDDYPAIVDSNYTTLDTSTVTS